MLNFHVLLILMVFHKLNFEYVYVFLICVVILLNFVMLFVILLNFVVFFVILLNFVVFLPCFVVFLPCFVVFLPCFAMFCHVFAMFCCVFLSFSMFCCVLVVKISLFLRFRFGFIVDNNFSVLIPLFCAIKLIISLDSSIVKFKPLKSVYRLHLY